VSLCVCSYEDRPEAMDGLILMGESLCRAETDLSLHLTVPNAPASVRAWAASRPEVLLTTSPPDGVSGWNIKPSLLLEELNAGRPEVLWLDDDMIVTRPLSSLLKRFPTDALIVAAEWNGPEFIPASHFWRMPSARPVPVINACVVRATQLHRTLLERWLEMLRDPRYRDAQELPFARRPLHLLHDGWLLIALLESRDFSQVSYDYLRLGRDIAQCAGLSGYRPHHRLLDLFRGPPALIHAIGRKPWIPVQDPGRVHRYLIELATDLSPYVLAARRVASSLGMAPQWLDARTRVGDTLRRLTAYHPGMAGLPLAIPHALHMKITQTLGRFSARAPRSSPPQPDPDRRPS
jgi:hypothetical protein